MFDDTLSSISIFADKIIEIVEKNILWIILGGLGLIWLLLRTLRLL